MKRMTILTVLLLVLLSFTTKQKLTAETMTINTPDGSVTIDVNDNTSRNRGYTSSGTIIDNISNKLEKLERNYISKLSRRDRKNAEMILDDVFSLLRMLPDNSNVTMSVSNNGRRNNNSGSATISFNQGGASISINEANSNSYGSSSNTTVVTNTAMSSSDFENFYKNVKNEAFENDKMSTIEVNTNHNWYNVNQVVRILGLFDFGNSKIKALRTMYRKVVDRNNAQKILQTFNMGDYKKKARNIINRY